MIRSGFDPSAGTVKSIPAAVILVVLLFSAEA